MFFFNVESIYCVTILDNYRYRDFFSSIPLLLSCIKSYLSNKPKSVYTNLHSLFLYNISHLHFEKSTTNRYLFKQQQRLQSKSSLQFVGIQYERFSPRRFGTSRSRFCNSSNGPHETCFRTRRHESV